MAISTAYSTKDANDADTLSSSFIPAYPEYTTQTTFDSTFYNSRDTQCAAIADPIDNICSS